jgi:hypothetical protein
MQVSVFQYCTFLCYLTLLLSSAYVIGMGIKSRSRIFFLALALQRDSATRFSTSGFFMNQFPQAPEYTIRV